MEEEYVKYETAKALAKVGFDWPCDTEYVTTPGTKEPRLATEMAAVDYGRVYGPENVKRVKAPTLEQAEKWLADVKGVQTTIETLATSGFGVALTEVFGKISERESKEQ